MIVCAATNNAKAALYQIFGQYSCILLHLHRIVFPRGLQVFTKTNCLSCNDMFQRPALCARENCRVEQHAHLLHFTFLRGQSPGIVEILSH